MKIKRSAFTSLILLLALMGCGKEQFGGAPQSTSSQADQVQAYEQLSCSSYTLIKPKVDILYVVDNSTSTYYVDSDIQKAIKGTVDKISSQFDYRVVGTPLIPLSGDPSPNMNFQYLTNSRDPVDGSLSGRRIISSSEFDFFSNKSSGGNAEAGLRRTIEFMRYHSSSGLLRNGAYHLVIMISNGRDTEVEKLSPYGNGETIFQSSVYNQRLSDINSLKSSSMLNSIQFRMISVTAQSVCKSGWQPSVKSYVKMAKDLYLASGATDSPGTQDAYDLCGGGISSIFTSVNNAIKQVVLPHTYKYWPITFTNDNNIDLTTMRVFVSSPTSSPSLIDPTKYEYVDNSTRSSINTRILPTLGEPSNARHLIRFTDSNEIVYPKCVSITSTSKVEYFGYITLPREPKVATIVVRINGVDIPASATNGWSYIGNSTLTNVKVTFPNCNCSDLPAVTKSGFMIKLNGKDNYYKSGDSVEAYYVGEGI